MKSEEYIWDYRNSYEWMKRVQNESFPPLIITCATTGGAHGKEVNPNLPETVEEQADAVYEAYKAGAVSVHVHARDPECQWKATGNPDHYSRLNKAIRERCPDIIINNTTGGSGDMPMEERIGCVYSDPRPDIASLNPGPWVLKIILPERKAPLKHPRPAINFDHCVSTAYKDVNYFAKTMKEKGIKPEVELYNPGQYWVLRDLIQEGNIDPPYMVQFVMGFQTSSFPTPANVLSLINELPPQSMFSLIGIGPFQLPMTMMGIIMGGHVRVGLEDNAFYRKGELIQSNAQVVKRVKDLAEKMNRKVATVAQARKMLGLPDKPNA